MISDWRDVYLQEKRRPGYVIENGRSLAEVQADASRRRHPNPPEHEKRKAA